MGKTMISMRNKQHFFVACYAIKHLTIQPFADIQQDDPCYLFFENTACKFKQALLYSGYAFTDDFENMDGAAFAPIGVGSARKGRARNGARARAL